MKQLKQQNARVKLLTEVDPFEIFLKSKKENEAIKDRILRDINTLFEKEDDYYKPVRMGNFWNNSYIEYESNGDRNKIWSVEENLIEIKP